MKRKTKAQLEQLRANARLGGLKGGKSRAATLAAKRRREIAIRAAAIRWAK